MDKFDLLPLLDYISPDDYEVWYQVGMALKYEGYTWQDWDKWSQGSSKYHPGECESKWNTFHEDTVSPVTGARITMLAKEGGWKSNRSTASSEPPKFLAWDAVIGKDTAPIVDEGFAECEPIPGPPKNWNPCEQLLTYINTLFQLMTSWRMWSVLPREPMRTAIRSIFLPTAESTPERQNRYAVTLTTMTIFHTR